MSTTFDIFPQFSVIPSYLEILELSTQRLHEFLQEFDIHAKPIIAVTMLCQSRDTGQGSAEELPLDPSGTARWGEIDPYREYAWFYVPPIPGGSDAYFSMRRPAGLNDELHAASQGQRHASLIAACSRNDHYWFFRRSAGQPAIVNLTYGLVAASFAKLTGGLIYSGDSAWDYERFRATADEFFTWYFRPEMALEPDNKEWSARCISYLAEELIG